MQFGLSGLASGFDWKTLVDQLMALERAPITRLTREKTANSTRSDRLGTLETRLTALQTAAVTLGESGLFSRRTATIAGGDSTWSATASDSTATGTYRIAVSQLATASKRTGADNIASGLHTADNVSSLTIATLPTAAAVTAGKFTVNGQQITVALTDSLQSVLDAIDSATSGAVTAAYSTATDKITLTGTGTITLGAANDTSNFLSVLRLANNGTSSVTSNGRLGVADTDAAIASSRLSTTITAVDGSGNGSFSINGETVSYNVNNDSLDEVLERINDSAAGVTAAYDAVNDRVVLTNKVSGDLGVSVSESAGGLLAALGLTTGATVSRGQNATFTVNGGSTLTSTSNTLGATAHGITGLSVTIDDATTETVTVAGDGEEMQDRIEEFITKFNAVQSYIEEQSKITTGEKGAVTAGLLAGNREVQGWARSLRQKAFASVSGLSGAITRLEHLGIDFKTGTNELEIKDQAKLTDALDDNAADVAGFFQQASTGFAAIIGDFAENVASDTDDQQDRLTEANTDLDRQIADLERRLTQQREVLESAFIRMEEAQANLNRQQQTLTNAFFGAQK